MREGMRPVAVEPAEGGVTLDHQGRLRANAIGAKDSFIIGMASSGPTASIALTLAAIVAASAYGGPIAIAVCFLPMMGIALAYRRLNHWEVNCGGSYLWAGRAISPYVGFMVGWIMLLGYFLGTISDALPIGPYALQIIWPSEASSSLAAAFSASIWLVVITVIAYIGIHATARLQWLFAAIEYTVVFVFAIVCLAAVFGGNSKSSAFSWSWFSWHGIGGATGLVNGILVAVYMYSGWDSCIYVNEETSDARNSPGRAAVLSVLVLAIMYAFLTFAYQGAVKPAALQANGADALSYIVGQIAGSPWDKVMIIAVLLSVVGATQTALVSGARIAFAMGDDRVLPPVFGKSHKVHKTPYVATLTFAGLALVVLWIYLLGSASIQSSFSKIVASVGLCFATFYAATGIAMAVYYRRLAARSGRNLLELALVPLASAGFLIWVIVRSIPGLGGLGGTVMTYLYVMLGLGLVLLLIARVFVRSGYFKLPVQAYAPAE